MPHVNCIGGVLFAGRGMVAGKGMMHSEGMNGREGNDCKSDLSVRSICCFFCKSPQGCAHASKFVCVRGLSDDSESSQYVYVYPVTLPKAISQI